MTKKDSCIAGIGIGLLVAAFTIRVFDLGWLVVSAGVLLCIVGGTGLLSRKP
jgi:hypothetical protein